MVRSAHAVTIVRADLAFAELVSEGRALARTETDRLRAWLDDQEGLAVPGEGPRGVALYPVKRFCERYGMTARLRIAGLDHDRYMRMGAALRHTTALLCREAAQLHPRLRSDLLMRRVETNIELWRLKRENERLQRAIEESQARLFSVYDSLDDAIIQIDHDCRVVSMNRSAAALTSSSASSRNRASPVLPAAAFSRMAAS